MCTRSMQHMQGSIEAAMIGMSAISWSTNIGTQLMRFEYVGAFTFHTTGSSTPASRRM